MQSQSNHDLPNMLLRHQMRVSSSKLRDFLKHTGCRAHFSGPQRFTVKNVGKTVKIYTLSHVPARTAITIPNGVFPDIGPVALSTDHTSVSFNVTKFTLLPIQSCEVIATIKPPQDVDATGFICITHPSSGSPRSPVVLDSEAFGTPLFRLDLVSPDIALNGTLNARASILFANPDKSGSFAKVPTLGAPLEVPYLGRNDLIDFLDNQVLLSNTFANGTIIPNGSYKILPRNLRPEK
ncbi:hypothetical protein DFH08DRAFT_967805 [Mycena albidolilacea]|uniref:C5a peptidase/Subtilisin-like protease SBT2-like Fn3-like domain-containing protein n=1 Tax=Mycena albidolilacea TaxID=1033008 RepID=A0AAD7EJT2_9AGAR|nr:hypothetical protein DFH08DRAFT_967805 [Mycena albidolilacea]